MSRMIAESRSDSERTARGWDTYWRGTGDIGAWTAGGAGHPAIRAFWSELFQAASTDPARTMVDIASGNGAVVECALNVCASAPPDIICVDISAAAIANIRRRFPGVQGLVCDARSIPLQARAFDLVTSQFGVEYAGLEAIDEAARLLAPGGRLALLIHHRAGSIHRECTASLDAISRVQESRFVPLADEMFRAGFAAVRGADRVPYEAAASRLAPAVAELERIIEHHGEHVAGDTVARLYTVVGRIHEKLPSFDPGEVLDWLARMETELDDYAARMAAMTASAVDQPAFERLAAGLRERLTLERSGPLLAPGDDLPLAWILQARGR